MCSLAAILLTLLGIIIKTGYGGFEPQTKKVIRVNANKQTAESTTVGSTVCVTFSLSLHLSNRQGTNPILLKKCF